MAAVACASVAVQRAILNGFVVDTNPFARYKHFHSAADYAPGCGTAIGTVAATLAALAYEIAVDVMRPNRQRGVC